jgi:ABC-2 type transport system permease protein
MQIPPGFTRDLRAGRGAQVQVLIDGSSSTIALQALQTSLGIAMRNPCSQWRGDRAASDARRGAAANPLQSDDEEREFFCAGVMGIALQIATVFATALSVVRERERGTLENLLVAPLSRPGLMLGKLTPYLCISMTMARAFFWSRGGCSAFPFAAT